MNPSSWTCKKNLSRREKTKLVRIENEKKNDNEIIQTDDDMISQ